MKRFTAGITADGDKLVQSAQRQITYQIGDRGPGGGFIFYAESGVYMEVSLTLGTGSWDSAMNAARNYKGGGFTDWRLPSQSELKIIYENLRRRNLGGLGDNTYWSSESSRGGDQNMGTYAFAMNFGNGKSITSSIGRWPDGLTCSFRAIRSF